MKNFIFLLAFCSFLCSLKAQDAKELPRIEHDTLFTMSGYNVKVGDTIHLGTGSNNSNGFFIFVKRNEAGFGAIMTASNDAHYNANQYALPSGWNGKKAVVVKLVDRGTKHNGYTYYALISGPMGSRYQVEIDNAIAAGEIIVPEQYRPHKPTQTVVVQTPVSVADELTKLKKLKDDGVITEEEYQAQKKKLLSN